MGSTSTGLAYIRARYYDPDSGRFISKDPKAGNDQDGQSLNRYVYAVNNPVIDISGLSAKEATGTSTKQPLRSEIRSRGNAIDGWRNIGENIAFGFRDGVSLVPLRELVREGLTGTGDRRLPRNWRIRLPLQRIRRATCSSETHRTATPAFGRSRSRPTITAIRASSGVQGSIREALR